MGNSGCFLGIRCRETTRLRYRECRALLGVLGRDATADRLLYAVLDNCRRRLRAQCESRGIDWRTIAAAINDPRPPTQRGLTFGPPRRRMPQIDQLPRRSVW